MDEGIAASDQRSTSMAQEMSDMPDFGALANLHSSISSMGKSRKMN
jgi:type IV secretory pathway TrbL component